MMIGYIRVSTEEQNTMRQEVMMQVLGVDELYIDKAAERAQTDLSLMDRRKYASATKNVTSSKFDRKIHSDFPKW